jgi:phosphoribosylanthranilate isomerase
MVRVKICGITNLEDALVAAEAGADALGFIFYPRSPRFITADAAAGIVAGLPPFLATVGVFVDEDRETVIRIREEVGLHALQLHGNESPEMVRSLPGPVIKGFRVGEEFEEERIDKYACSAILLDAHVKGVPGGTGKVFDWEVARRCAERWRVILAGGLTPENVAKAVEKVRPYAVDVAGGVEIRPGKKDPDLVRRFISEAKGR